jgi:uncharacterized protein YcbK (DUF882 family)
MTDSNQAFANRRLLLKGLAAVPLVLSTPRLAYANSEPRELSLFHTHTGERLKVVYFDGQKYEPEALAQLNKLMRDHRSGEVHKIDPGVFDILSSLCTSCGKGTYDIISGYRSAHTNELLRGTGGGGVAKRSLHMDGKAIDIRLNGRATPQLRKAAIALARGGVGYYPESNFLHVDTGRVRTWGATG